MTKGVRVQNLFESNIFFHTLNFQDKLWPGVHADTSKILRPHNESHLKLRYEYPKIFSAIHKRDQKKEKKRLNSKKPIAAEKTYKIEYTVNILPSM